jgi:hypothetical protein
LAPLHRLSARLHVREAGGVKGGCYATVNVYFSPPPFSSLYLNTYTHTHLISPSSSRSTLSSQQQHGDCSLSQQQVTSRVDEQRIHTSTDKILCASNRVHEGLLESIDQAKVFLTAGGMDAQWLFNAF